MGWWESPNGMDRVSRKAQMVIEGQVGEIRECRMGWWESSNSVERVSRENRLADKPKWYGQGQWESPDSDKRIGTGRAQIVWTGSVRKPRWCPLLLPINVQNCGSQCPENVSKKTPVTLIYDGKAHLINALGCPRDILE